MANPAFKLVLIILTLFFISLDTSAFEGSGGTIDLNLGNISDISGSGSGGTIDVNFVSVETGTGLWDGGSITANTGVFFEASAPTVTITNPPSGFSTIATLVTLTYTGSDAENNISKYTVQLDDETQIDNGLNLSYTFTGLSVGSHALKVFATDSTDLVSDTASIDITITSDSSGDGGSGSSGGSGGGRGGGGSGGSFCIPTVADPDGDCVPRSLDCNNFRRDVGVCNLEDNLVCFNFECVSLFDIKILEFDSPIKLGEFFDFTYFLKGVGEINADVKISYWIEKDGEIISSGVDTIYLGESEEKTETGKLFLPTGTTAGAYEFFMEVTFGDYTVQSQRTIGITVVGEEGTVIIEKLFEVDFSLNQLLIKESGELSGVVTFENFGESPVLVNLTFIILDQNGFEVYNEKAALTVMGEESLAWNYETLQELPEGKYTIILQALYGDKSAKFVQNIEVKREKTTFSFDYISEIVTLPFLGIGLLLLLLIGLVLWTHKKRKKEKKTTKTKPIKKIPHSKPVKKSKHGKQTKRSLKKKKLKAMFSSVF